ncbi:MAG: thioredoxin domain-containing protein [Pseudomonadota bacterium]
MPQISRPNRPAKARQGSHATRLTAAIAVAPILAAALGGIGHTQSIPQPSVEKAGSATVKVVNFTADWCGNCQKMNPRLEDAVARFDTGEVAVINLDLTNSQSDDEDERIATFETAITTADANGVSYLWDWYGGLTGLAVLVSGDNGEPISCANSSLSADEIEGRLREALVLTLRAPAGSRKPNGPDCPPPLG